MKKSKFLPIFTEVLSEFSNLLALAFSRDTLQAKILQLGGISQKEYYRGIDNLRQRKILQGRNSRFHLTPKGKEWLVKSKINYFKLKNKKWDNKWRVIIFDIPKDLHRERVRFSSKLKNLGFYSLQKSVFVMPYSCEEELSQIAQDFRVSEFVDVIIAENVGFKESEIRKYYHL